MQWQREGAGFAFYLIVPIIHFQSHFKCHLKALFKDGLISSYNGFYIILYEFVENTAKCAPMKLTGDYKDIKSN